MDEGARGEALVALGERVGDEKLLCERGRGERTEERTARKFAHGAKEVVHRSVVLEHGETLSRCEALCIPCTTITRGTRRVAAKEVPLDEQRTSQRKPTRIWQHRGHLQPCGTPWNMFWFCCTFFFTLGSVFVCTVVAVRA